MTTAADHREYGETTVAAAERCNVYERNKPITAVLLLPEHSGAKEMMFCHEVDGHKDRGHAFPLPGVTLGAIMYLRGMA